MSETTNVTKISGLLEAIDKSRIDLSNDAKELFSEGKITFDQYKEMINQIQNENNKVLSEVCSAIKELDSKKQVFNKELEEKRIEYEHQLQEKQIEINSKPKTFMQIIDDFGYNFMKGTEALKM